MNLKDALRGSLAEDDHDLLVRGYDVLGDLAIIIIPQGLDHLETEIGTAILRTSPHIRMVARRAGNYTGEYRTIPLKKIAGEGGFATLHKEFGVRLHVDPLKVYFSPRSGPERFRIAGSVMPGERVLVMFSGIGPLPLMIGLHSDAAAVTGIEKNPEAHRLAVKNLQANRRVQNVYLQCGDVEDLMPQLEGGFDRIAMPLPLSAGRYLPLALAALKCTGWLHYYDFQDTGEEGRAEETVARACAMQGRRMTAAEVRRCGHVAPGRHRICVDARVE